MEDSEQRKKRLKEMRLEADLAEDSGGGGGAEGSGRSSLLSNPLAEEAPSNMLSEDNSNAAPRFNYYTDPMNAFSSDKRSSVNVRPVPDYLPPMLQFSSPHLESTNRQMPPSPTQALPTSYRNPVWSGPRCPPQYNFPFRPSGGESTNPQMPPSPTQALPTSYRYPVWNGPRCPPQYNFPFRPSGGGTYPSPRFESPSCPSFNSAPVMNHRPNHNPNPAPAYMNNPNFCQGRGRGFWNNNTRSPDSGRGRGQGSSSHGRWSNEDRGHGPNRFYKMSMVEDPWKCLKPIIWNSTYSCYSNTAYTPENSKPWIPSKSTSTKQEGSPAVFSKASSGPSLAEYLASALNEASTTEENV